MLTLFRIIGNRPKNKLLARVGSVLIKPSEPPEIIGDDTVEAIALMERGGEVDMPPYGSCTSTSELSRDCAYSIHGSRCTGGQVGGRLGSLISDSVK